MSENKAMPFDEMMRVISQPAIASRACSELAAPTWLAAFGSEYKILADLNDGWFLVAHPNGPAISTSKFNLLASLAHEHEDVPERIRRSATWALIEWAAKQPTWPRAAKEDDITQSKVISSDAANTKVSDSR